MTVDQNQNKQNADLQDGSEVFISMKDGPEGQVGYLATIPAGAKVSFSKGPDGELDMVPEPDTEPPTLRRITAKEIEADPDRSMNMQTADLRWASQPDDHVYINREKPGLMSAAIGGNAQLKQGVVSMTDAEVTAALPDFAPQKKSDMKLGSPG